MVSSGEEAMSVGCAMLALAGAVAAWRWPTAWMVAVASLAAVVWFKRRFLLLAWRAEGPMFAVRALGAYVVQAVAVGAGAAHGFVLGLVGKR